MRSMRPASETKLSAPMFFVRSSTIIFRRFKRVDFRLRVCKLRLGIGELRRSIRRLLVVFRPTLFVRLQTRSVFSLAAFKLGSARRIRLLPRIKLRAAACELRGCAVKPGLCRSEGFFGSNALRRQFVAGGGKLLRHASGLGIDLRDTRRKLCNSVIKLHLLGKKRVLLPLQLRERLLAERKPRL